jgi:Leu/Phe-tRNA-protein transferase
MGDDGDALEPDDPDAEVPNGLVAVGGSLDPDTVLRAYRAGIFPWSSDPVITWWCPDPRAIFDLETFRAPRSLRKSIRRAGWRFTVDTAFEEVMRCCAEPTPERPSTWITQDFVDCYLELHRRGFAHSVERQWHISSSTCAGRASCCSTRRSPLRTWVAWAPCRSRAPSTCAA